MRLIGWKERQRRMRAAENEAWEAAGKVAQDPGLRERYATMPRAPIRLIVCPLLKNVNHGGLLRLADAFRLERVDFSPEEDGGVDMSGNRGTSQYQPFQWIPVEDAIAAARTDAYRVVAVTMSARSVALQRHEWHFPTALVLGSENEGIPPEVESLCDESVAIPLFGMVSSLNVVSAAAIVVHAAVHAYRQTAEFAPARKGAARLLSS